MLMCWCRVGSFSCSLHNIPLVLQLHLPVLWRHFGVFPQPFFDFVPNFHGFVREAFFLACTYDCLRLYYTPLYNLRNSSVVLFGNDASRLGILALLD